MAKRKTTEQEKKVFLFLNWLRESGKTNMFGARPFIVKKFKISSEEAGVFLRLWMKVFKADGNYEEIDAPELVAIK